MMWSVSPSGHLFGAVLVAALLSFSLCQDHCRGQDGKPGQPGVSGRDGLRGKKGEKGEPGICPILYGLTDFYG